MLTHIKHLLERNAYTIAIVFTIFISITSLVSLKGMKTISIGIHNFDKLAHFISYFLLTLSWFYATQHHVSKARLQKFLVVILIVYGIIIEAIQGGMTTHRQADIFDILANSIGVLLAAALLIIFKKVAYITFYLLN